MKTERSFGDTIKNLRERNNLTLTELANAVKISTSMLGKIEKNNRRPTRKVISRLSNYFGISERELTVSFLSDAVLYEVLMDGRLAIDVLRAAERKVRYLKMKSGLNQ